VTLADVHKRLRVKLSYGTRNNNGRTEIPPKVYTVLPASTWKLSITDILNAPEKLKAQVNVVPPKLESSGVTLMSYGVDKANVDRNYFEVRIDRLVNKEDNEKLLQKLRLPILNASESYEVELKKFKSTLLSANRNLVVQVLNTGFLLRETDSLEAKCGIARERRKLQPLVEQILRTAELIAKPDLGKELADLKNRYVGTDAGYPQGSSIKPMQAVQSNDRQAAILEFSSGWNNGFKSHWESLVTSEQAFLTAMESARNDPYLFEAEGKIKVEQKTPKKTLIQCPLAVSLRVTFSPKLEELMRELSPESSVAAKAGKAMVNAGPKADPSTPIPPK